MSLEKQELIEDKLIDTFSEEAFEKRLSEADFNDYKNESKKLSYQKGDCIFQDGIDAKGVYFINKGIAKLSKCGVYGKDQILRFIKEGDLIGYRSILIGEEYQAKVETLTEVEATFLPKDLFLHLLKVDNQMSFAMLQKLAYELGEASNNITFLAQKTVRERLAEILLVLEQKLGVNNEGFINIVLTREEIANLIGTATESAIRLISEFKQDNMIVTKGKNIKLIDRKTLKRISHANL